MSGLVDFLRARLAEDEATARAEPEHSLGGSPRLGWEEVGPGSALLVHPARVLAEVEAKRLLIADYEALHADYRVTRSPETEARRFQALVAIGQIATAYADHPDYDDAWRP